jgi:peptide/nickel transport system permease protein
VKLRRSGSASFALAFLGAAILLAIAAPLIAARPDEVNLAIRLQPPDGGHWLGTDELGRDLAARMLYGARVSLLVGFTAAIASMLIGSIVGSLAGYYGGAADWIAMRAVETIVSFPLLFLVLGIVALFGPSLKTIIIAVAATSWTQEARLVRGEMLRVREEEFAEAARASGATDVRLLLRHLLPNAIAPALVSATFGVGSVILIESALSFLGMGSPLPNPSWGAIVATGEDYLGTAWWLSLFPGIAIFLTVASCNVVGEWLQE